MPSNVELFQAQSSSHRDCSIQVWKHWCLSSI